jgi:hypothetical protein
MGEWANRLPRAEGCVCRLGLGTASPSLVFLARLEGARTVALDQAR